MRTTEQVKEFLRTNFTFEGRIFYPQLFEPKANRNGRMQYSVLFAWNFQQNQQKIQQLGAFLAEAKQMTFPTIPDAFFVNPLKKWGVYQRQDGKPNHQFLENCYWINMQSGEQFPPPVVDGNRNPVMDASQVYSGRNAAVNFNFYAIDGEKKGLGTNVNAVMLLEGGDQVSGGGAVDVNSVFGDFAADMNMGQQNVAPQGGQDQQQNAVWPPQGAQNNGGGFI